MFKEVVIPPNWQVLYTKEEITAATTNLVKELLQIDGIYDKQVILVQVLESARIFAEDLRKGLVAAGVDAKVESIKASSYRDDPEKQGEIKISGLENVIPSGKEIRLVVDDMVDSGKTLEMVMAEIRAVIETAPVFSAVFLKKLSSTFQPDFVAMKQAITGWVAGYGINGNSPELGPSDGRDLPHIVVKIN